MATAPPATPALTCTPDGDALQTASAATRAKTPAGISKMPTEASPNTPSPKHPALVAPRSAIRRPARSVPSDPAAAASASTTMNIVANVRRALSRTSPNDTIANAIARKASPPKTYRRVPADLKEAAPQTQDNPRRSRRGKEGSVPPTPSQRLEVCVTTSGVCPSFPAPLVRCRYTLSRKTCMMTGVEAKHVPREKACFRRTDVSSPEP